MKQRPYCLVLSGGGAKGVYHIGVWRALQELQIPVKAFIGNSIGAIIACFLAQGEGEFLEEASRKIGIDYVLNLPEEFIKDGELHLNLAKPAGFKKFYASLISKKGLDTAPIRRILAEHIHEPELRRAGNDLGVTTFNISDFRSRDIFLEEMEAGEVINYILASSAFPGFERPEIGGKKYLDGGVYDNIPYAMARRRGHKRIIVVDISGLGMKRKMNFEGGETVYIKNTINMGGVMDFNREFLDRYRELGYLDTLKTFQALRGHHYAISQDARLEGRFEAFWAESEQQGRLQTYLRSLTGKTAETGSAGLRMVFPQHSKYNRLTLAVFVDCAASILSLERICKWRYRELFEAIVVRLDRIEESLEAIKSWDKKEIEAVIREEIKERRLIKTPYYHYALNDRFMPATLKKLLKRTLCEIFPELPAGVFFLEFLREFWKKR